MLFPPQVNSQLNCKKGEEYRKINYQKKNYRRLVFFFFVLFLEDEEKRRKNIRV